MSNMHVELRTRIEKGQMELVLVSANGSDVDSPAKLSPQYPVDEDVDGWRVLGRRLPSGELMHCDYDMVDPELVDFDRLALPNSEAVIGHGHSIGMFGLDPLSRRWRYVR